MICGDCWGTANKSEGHVLTRIPGHQEGQASSVAAAAVPARTAHKGCSCSGAHEHACKVNGRAHPSRLLTPWASSAACTTASLARATTWLWYSWFGQANRLLIEINMLKVNNENQSNTSVLLDNADTKQMILKILCRSITAKDPPRGRALTIACPPILCLRVVDSQGLLQTKWAMEVIKKEINSKKLESQQQKENEETIIAGKGAKWQPINFPD